MNYFIVECVESGLTELYQSDRRVKKGDYVAIPNYNDEPITAKVMDIVSKLRALKMSTEPEFVISVIDMSAYNAKREKELNDIILIDKMEKEIKRIKNMETLEKYAGKDPKMLELYNALIGQSSIDDDVAMGDE